MKTIFRVAKTELRTLFYSPIAWFLLIVFMVQCAIVYMGSIGSFARMQEMQGMMGMPDMSLTERVFVGRGALFSNVMEKLYLYIPLLTMSLISRETSSGTIKLLYSSPIKVREIIFGKFLAMMVYSLLLIAIVSIFVISGLFHIPNLDKGMLLTGLLGFYLLLCAYASIGLFMSCLTTYQVVAAICTFVMIGALSYVGTLWQRIAFVRELTYFLSINGRAENMLNGMLTTKDVIYFITIVYIFLGLSIYKLKAGMESKPALVKAGRYAAIVASALLIGYVSSVPSLIGYYDATVGKQRTLTPKVQSILTDLGNEPLEITAYTNLLDRYYWLGGPATYNLNIARWEPFTRFKHNIELKTVAYYDSSYGSSYIWKTYPGKNLKEMAEQYVKNMDMDLKDFKSPAEIRKIIDLRPESNRYVMQLKWKGKTTFLRVFDDQMMWPGETEVAAALKRLQQAKLPKVAFLTGDLERDIDKVGDRDYRFLTNLATFRNSLVNQGFDVDTVSLETQEIPADIATLVIADPKLSLRPITMAKVQAYINNGGNLLIAGEPGRQAILNPLLQQLGVQMMDGMLVQVSKTDLTPDQVTPDLTQLSATFSKPLAERAEDSFKVFMEGTAGLSFVTDGAYTIKPLLVSNAKLSWNRIKPLDLDMVTSAVTDDFQEVVTSKKPDTGRTALATIAFSAADGDVKGPLAPVVALTRKVNNKEQRIVVAGDADFISNAGLRRQGMANFVFNTALFSWLSYGEFPIDASRPKPKDTRVSLAQDDVGFFRILYIWVLPGILLAFGAILLIRRKRK
ncbi:ABC transporter permease subunit [Chitinophaga sp. SYP-B3965]|uniref:Gldg family protein n=1 Tax=Chitinophaga sp. SYP-B3965 TaxID=2663120 RepID=UPI0012995AD7|nr:Gldg family protein [Chitinophaga sp. SYP-B3965]MRG45743.1 ABC transporter permease subunit [Chitinophaga sp. SYP-B3965]